MYAKRTALAYILFNLVAGLIAILLLPMFLGFIGLLGEYAGLTPGAVSLAAFHTLFIGVGVALFLPVTPRFARLVERLLPERGDDMSQRLDDSLLGIPSVSLEASQRTLERVMDRLLEIYRQILIMLPSDRMEGDLLQARQALEHTFDFVTRIQLSPQDDKLSAQRIAQLHAIDHMLRFRGRLYDIRQAQTDFADPAYSWVLENSLDMLNRARSSLAMGEITAVLEELESDAGALAGASRQIRHELLQEGTLGSSASSALGMTDAFRSLERSGLHIWRICHYLSQGRPGERIPQEEDDLEKADGESEVEAHP